MKPLRDPVHRRDLLRAWRASAPEAAVDPARAAGPVSRGDLIKLRRPAMGTFFEVRLPAEVPGAVVLGTQALDLIDALEAQMTVYRDDSEVSRLNAMAHLGPVEVEAGLFRLLQQAVELGRRTGGAYDVTAGALSVAWGFFRGPRRVPTAEQLAEARSRTGTHHLRMDAERRTIAFDRPGILINLGSIGKGHALDRAARLIRQHWWPTPALIHGGQSSLFALGSPPDRFAGRWEIALRNPLAAERPLGVIRLRNRGLGTSGAAFQAFESDGQRYGHILDPRTGAPPTSGPLSVTVLAPTAAEADALSTALYLIGPEEAAILLRDRPEVGALFVLEDPRSRRLRIRRVNLSDDDFGPDPNEARVED